MAKIELKNICKSYGKLEVVRGVSLSVNHGELVVFVGPSGCGKSTLLRLIAGLENITSGDLLIEDVRVNDTPPKERGIAMVFQSYALYPHMSVFNNMAFGLKISRFGKDEITEKVEAAARILQIDNLLDRLPKQLSGGQRQRVAIGRAIVRDPQVFLFDEPLSNLDAALRVQTRVEIADLHTKLGASMLSVSHDQVEAMTLADRIAVLNNGKLEQIGKPLEVYNNPCNLFVAQFIGSPAMNLIKARVTDLDKKVLKVKPFSGGGVLTTKLVSDGVARGDEVTLGVRPQDLKVVSGRGDIEGELILVEELGETNFFHVRLEHGGAVISRGVERGKRKIGTKVNLTVNEGSWHLFNAQGEAMAHS